MFRNFRSNWKARGSIRVLWPTNIEICANFSQARRWLHRWEWEILSRCCWWKVTVRQQLRLLTCKNYQVFLFTAGLSTWVPLKPRTASTFSIDSKLAFMFFFHSLLRLHSLSLSGVNKCLTVPLGSHIHRQLISGWLASMGERLDSTRGSFENHCARTKRNE